MRPAGAWPSCRRARSRSPRLPARESTNSAARILDVIAPAGQEREAGFITSLRHEQLLKESLRGAGPGPPGALAGIPHEMLLLDLYAALQPIDAITGATTADDILNRIFATFCIGK